MASATKKPIGQFEYTLTLSEDEIRAVRDILGLVTGSSKSRRRFSDTVLEAFKSVGICYPGLGDVDGTIRFS